MLIRVLVGIQDAALRTRIHGLVQAPDVLVVESESHSYDLALVDGTLDELESRMQKMTSLPERPQLVAMMREDEAHVRAQLLARGVLAVLDASLSDDLLGPAMAKLLSKRRENQRQHYELSRRSVAEPDDLVYESEAMRRVVATAHRIARADSAVLLLGETGVGKERLASLIHGSSPRSAGPFVAVNCAAIPGELFESELFGHEKGAFTGAARSRRGQFELAHEGTLFLDEVGEVPLHLQAKLLRALQERRIKPLGGEKAVEVDVRVIAATNRDLQHEMAEGRFRRDLYYRLGVVELAIPPLRDRIDDIPVIARAFLRRYGNQMNRDVDGFSEAAMRALSRYPWPGNVRELTNVIERAVLLCGSSQIEPSDLPEAIEACGLDPLGDGSIGNGGMGHAADTSLPLDVVRLPLPWTAQPWKLVRENLLLAGERAYLSALLQACGGRVGEAAKRAGISSRALFEKMRRHGLKKEDFRGS